MEIGFLSLGEHLPDPVNGGQISQAQRISEIIDAAVLAEQVGFYCFASGEHHSPHYAISAPPVLLAAIGARTERIRLRSAVTLIVTLDPLRIAEDYATLDVASGGGRVDIVVGKGIYSEPFELFGPAFEEADEAFWENTDLLLRLLSEEDVHWEGRFRRPIEGHTTQPRPVGELPVWIGLGRSLGSPEGAARRGLPAMMGNVLGVPEDAMPRVNHYRATWAEEGRDPADARLAAGIQAHVARNSQDAKRRWEPYYLNYYTEMAKVGKAMREVPAFDFAEQVGPTGPAVCGSPAEVAERLLEMHALWGNDEQFFQLDIGGLPYPLLAESIELFGTEVLPLLQKELATA